jgi:hypothetical protein
MHESRLAHSLTHHFPFVAVRRAERTLLYAYRNQVQSDADSKSSGL